MVDFEKQLITLISELWEIPSDERTEEIVEEVNRLSPDPNWSDYIYYSEEFVNDDESLNVEGVVRKILSYKPTQM